MEKYKNKLWKDLESDTERAEFIECGRAWETGIIAKAIENDLADVYRYRAEVNADAGAGDCNKPHVTNFVCAAPESFFPCNVNDNGKCTLPTHCDYQRK